MPEGTPSFTSLEGEATALAASHDRSLAPGHRFPGAQPGHRRLEDATNRILARLHDGVPEETRQYPYTQWLLDNGHVLRAALQQIRKGLPRKFYRQLPTVADDKGNGRRPRVAALVDKAIIIGQAPVELGRFERFCRAYQTTSPLTIGELWALPTMLRIRLLREICEICERASTLSRSGARADEIDNVTSGIAACITSLRNVSAVQWKVFVERLSRVDGILRRDPARAYARMDFDTRNDYRDTIELVARRTGLAEWDIAAAALRLAREARDRGASSRETHVGYYLVDAGVLQLMPDLGVRRPLLRRTLPQKSPQRSIVYISLLVLTAAALASIFAGWLRAAGTPPALVALSTALAFIPALTLASNLIHTLLARLRRPRRLPKMDFSKGIPPEHRSIVAVPAMLSSRHAIDETLHVLELNFLGNGDPSLQFVLLTDYPDAHSETLPGDKALLDYAADGIAKLNRRYAAGRQDRFVLLHRRRRWNEVAGLWMGWERKRGKLVQFNDLLRGGGGDDYEMRRGELIKARECRHVITLDADTLLPTGAAARLVGVMTHPLNRPEVDADRQRITNGYSIIQPRIEVNPATSSGSTFARIYAGDVTLDLYTHAVSDVYQDLFAQGIFAGKGIYDVDAFRATAHARIPENRILSHDLLEGLCGRAGLASDIVLLEDYPTSVLAHLKRLHRWIRGDWQLLPWLFGCRPCPQAQRFRPGVTGGWQLFDNLRRSLVAPAIIGLFLLSWLVLPLNPWALTAVVTITPGIGLILHALTAFRTSTWRWGTARSSMFNILGHAGNDLARWFMMLALMPVEALVALDAICRTLYRLAWSRRNLLEWSTAAEVARDIGSTSSALPFWKRMWAGPVWAGFNLLAILLLNPAAIPAATALLVLWAISPALAFHISQPDVRAPRPLPADDRAWLRRVARSTWRFFEQQVGPGSHWLPPDNIQLDPSPQTARQTSPTNIGFGMLSAAAARDLGYIGLREYVYHIHHTLQSIVRLEKYRGHLYNWYSLTDAQPLAPRYVSTVDSGNHVAAMIAVRVGLLEISGSKILLQPVLDGLEDDAGLMREQLDLLGRHDTARQPEPLVRAVEEIVHEIRGDAAPAARIRQLAEVHCSALNSALIDAIESGETGWTNSEISAFRTTAGSFARRAAAALKEIHELFPWLLAPPRAVDSEAGEPPAELLDAALPELGASPLRALPARIAQVVDKLRTGGSGEFPESAGAARFCEALQRSAGAVEQLLEEIDALAATLARLIDDTDFRFLYDNDRNLFHVGYRVDTAELDTSYYDLLASEARLASFVAIAKGDVPPKHWVHLGRPLTSIRGLRILLSWSATSFEYLMPRVLMRTPRFGLLAQSCRGAVKQQQLFGREHGIPWGVSESGYYHFDQHGRYQYQAFGIPRMGLKWDQGERLVISSYAGFLALPFDSPAAIANARVIEQLGGRGELGFFEALDFGAASKPPGVQPKVVKSYMAHHQGMSLTAIANLLTGDRFVTRFHRDPRIASAEYLLHEQLPLRAQTQPLETFEAPLKQAEPASVTIESWTLGGANRNVVMLGNSRLSSLVTSLGGGNLLWRGFAMTRWTPHVDGMNGGSRVYIRDLDQDVLWSPGLGAPGKDIRIVAAPDTVEIRDTRNALLVRQQIAVAPFVDLELRKLSITNDGDRPRRLFVCSSAEPVLADAQSDARHPAFSKLFIADEYLDEQQVLLFRRRPRSADDEQLCLACKAITDPAYDVILQYESDRRAFLGRNGSRAAPAALTAKQPELRCRAGETLDPVAALGFAVTIPARSTFQCAFVTGAGDDEVRVLRDLDQFESIQAVNWTIADARRHVQHELTLLELTSLDVRRAAALAGSLLLPPASDGGRTLAMASARRAQSFLWRHGISGDRPIVTIVISDAVNFRELEALARALAVCQARGMTGDIVFLDESESAYAHPTHDRLQEIIRKYLRRTATNRQFGSYIVPAIGLEAGSREAFALSSEVMLDLRMESWPRQLARQQAPAPVIPGFLPQPSSPVRRLPVPQARRPTRLLLDNGLSGIDPDNYDYVVWLENRDVTPAPWCNVLANPEFGTLISESGSSFSWYRNSSEYALTTWSNDPVRDRPGEATYIRDEETGMFWSPLPGPARDEEPYLVRHGVGSSSFEHVSEGLRQAVEVIVDPREPIKFLRLRLENLWPRDRRLTITCAAEWRLGGSGTPAGTHLLPEWDAANNTFYVRNGFDAGSPETTAFLCGTLPAHGVSFDGEEFLGALRSWRRPAGLQAIGLSGRIAPCGSPLSAYQVHVSLAEGESCELHFSLGAGRDREHAAALAERARLPGAAQAAYERQRQSWKALLGSLTVDTPDVALNAMLNAWLPYQVVSSRLNGRLGFYQASGGLGFRDQLQDVLAMLHLRPDMTAAQIVRAASVQFEEGDVLHWWHEDPLRGVRTRCSDDLLWLPYVVSQYLRVTRDLSLLDREVPFLHGLPLADSEHERYAEFSHGDDSGSIYEHCCRAIDARMTFGSHGLPPIGTGDWNDGFSNVGSGGKGESVWMAWFLIDVCRRFEPICRLRKDTVRAGSYRRLRLELGKNAEQHAWTGDWYLRGYYDDGSVLGGPERSECRIDLNAQTWAVIADALPDRQRRAMRSVENELIDREHRLIKLLAPPFHTSRQEPGYIKAYPPGVRENGGQYTHAAAWALLAAARSRNPVLVGRWLHWLNPLNRSGSRQEIEHYRIEPYVAAGDIYGHPPFTGRGGWSWYTGSAAWLYRVAIENVLGLERRGKKLYFRPCLPAEWDAFDVTLRFSAASYRIRLHDPGRFDGRSCALLQNGELLPGSALRLQESGDYSVHVFADRVARDAWRRGHDLAAAHEERQQQM